MNTNKISILFFLLCICYTCVSAQYEKPEGVIRIMTYNVAYCRGYDSYQDGSKTNPYNTERIGKIIKALDPDIIALQELDSGNINKRFLLQEIQKASGIDYEVIYGMSDLAPVGNYGIGILIKKKYPVLQVRKIKLPGTVYGTNPPVKNNDRLLFRIMTDRFYFMCTHLDLNDDQRVASAAIINNELDYMRKPTFLAGDMNDSHRWGGGAFAQFFNDKWDRFSTDEFTISNPKNESTIDYILYYNYKDKNEYSPVSTHAIRGMLTIPGEPTQIQVEYASDHLPVIVDIKDNTSVGMTEQKRYPLSIIQKENRLSINGLPEGHLSYHIFSNSGSCMDTGNVTISNNSIAIDSLTKGTYILNILQNGNAIYNYKFMK